jgi:aminobenzoyl-glutamate utilization protein B
MNLIKIVIKASLPIFAGLALSSLVLGATADYQKSIDNHQKQFEKVALDLWGFSEMGYQEVKSTSVLQAQLKKEGFKVTAGIAGIPTAFKAEFGSGGPTIGILGEFDALPGLAQSTSPFKETLGNATGAGQACGHNLFGAGSAWAAVAVKEWLEKSGIPGKVVFYGTPAEEGGSGKVYMAREGAFKNVDILLHWHPGSSNSASPRSTNSNMSGKFTFKGISAHAASAPHKGRSALDGVESMNMMVNMMREHVPQDSRIHYVITKGGLAPNVVPDLAEVYYYVRHPRREMVKELFERVANAGRGAALGTDTKMSYDIMHGNYSLLPNETLQRVMQTQLEELGGVSYSSKEQEYAETIYKTLVEPSGQIGDQRKIDPYKRTHGYGSTDVGDVSWLIPTGGIQVASWVPGTAGHSWQAVSTSGTSIGLKGTKLAAQALTATALAIYKNPSIADEARKELQENVGPDFNYEALLGDRKPPLDYRVN